MTIVGVGGVSKTVLARAVTPHVGGDFDDGPCLIELAPLADPSLVATVAAKALDVKPGQKTAIEATAQALARRRILVVLNNCERLVQAVAETVESLRPGAPGAHWLVTSREPP